MQKNRLSNIKKIVKTLLIFQFFLIAHIVKAESFSTDHAKFTIIQEHSEVKAGAKSQLLIKVDLDKGWHSYWENPGDSGYPLAINLAEKSIFEITGKLSQNPEIIVIGDLINFGYSNTFYIKYNLQFDEDLKEKDYEQEFSISILVCKDVCIPETVEASLEIEVNDKNEINELFLDKIVQLEYLFPSNINNIVNYNIQGDEIVLAVENFANLKKSDEVYFFPFLETLIHYQASQNSKIADKIYVKLPGKNNTEVEQLKGILRLGNNYYNIDAELDQKLSFPIEEVSLIYVLKLIFYAIMGGLILNFMPCVFPVLSLKCLHIANCKNKHISEIKRSSFYYFLGIEVSFIIFAMLVVFLKNTGLSIGWGFHMQSVFFVGFLIILFYLIALNLSDVFNFDNFYLPNLNLKSTSESINSFFSGALMTIIATPCTAPFMAAAVGFAFTQDNHMIYLIFLALGLGLSLPVILISLNQSFIRLLPKSGRWLESFKQFLAFPFYLTTIWLLWIFNNLTNSELLFIFLLILLLLTFVIWLSNKTRSFFLKLSFIVILIISINQFYNYLNFNVRDNQVIKPQSKYLYFTEYTKQDLAILKQSGKKIFVNVTADWCITCKYNKFISFGTSEIIELFNNNEVYFIEADWTNYDPYITNLLAEYDRSGIPLYLYIDDGNVTVLPQLLNKRILTELVID